jgi:Tfp pilus assembly protein PilF
VAQEPELTDADPVADEYKLLALCERVARGSSTCRAFRGRAFEHGEPAVATKLFMAANELFAAKDYDGAKVLLVECVRRDPEIKYCHKLLASTYEQLGDDHLAELEFDRYQALSWKGPAVRGK